LNIDNLKSLVGVEPVGTSKELLGCDKEPIHIPGLIQPHGALLTVALAERVVRQVSVNLGEVLGLEPDGALGRPLPDLLHLPDGTSWAGWIAAASGAVRWTRATDPAGREFELFAHRRGEVAIVEVEPARRWDERALLGFERALHEAVARIQGASDLETLCTSLTDEVARLGGFDRVMIYRFDEDWNGTVVAERVAAGVDSYLGHHFPSADIPAQARAMFLSSWLRTVPDVGYTPIPIQPTLDPSNGQPLDLGQTLLRSVSPIHVEYLKNMGVGGSLTISLLREGRLWGLIACHHRGPRYLSHRERSACELIGRLASALLGACEARADVERRRRLEEVHQRLRTSLIQAGDVVAGLTRGANELLALADSASAGVAVQFEGQWTLFGATPPADELPGLVGWLAATSPDFEVFSTDALPRLYPAAERWRDVASGLVAISLPKKEGDGILWFRPEVIRTVPWAGDPSKPVVHGAAMRLHPRKSFATWREVVRNRSQPWEPGIIGAVRELRRSIIEFDLQRQFLKERTARQARDHVLGVVSHDLRNPLSVVLLGIDGLKDELAQSDTLRAMELAGRRMRSLIEDLLSLAQLEAGTYRLDKTEVGSDALLREAVELFQPLAAAKPVELVAPSQLTSYRLSCDRERILQALSNLIGNAIKFTPARGHVSLDVTAVGDEIVFSVADDGPGIPGEALPHVFNRFWQATQPAHVRRQGAGLGLSIVKGVVEAHGGRVWVDSRLGEGARFSFSVPRRA
jgi:light-regulated signal transduction histidine kinase (bacteriophytochrome)